MSSSAPPPWRDRERPARRPEDHSRRAAIPARGGARRRLSGARVAVPALLLAIGLAVAGLTLAGGGDRSPGPRARAARGDRGAPAGRRAPSAGVQRVASAPPAAVPRPRRIVGTGPFVTLAGDTVQRRYPAHPGRRVALTFDDGPGPQTGAFLRRLQQLHARATFFVVGYGVAARPAMLRRLRAAGMEIANHSRTHPLMSSLPPAAQHRQIFDTQRLIDRTIGLRPGFFRPPMWGWNLATAREEAAAGMVGVLFSVDTADWSRPGVGAIVRAARRVRAGGVLAMHDAGGDRTQTLKALGPIVHDLRRRGLEPVTVGELYGRG